MLVLILVKKCVSNRVDELASRVKANRQKSDFPHPFLSGVPLGGAAHI